MTRSLQDRKPTPSLMATKRPAERTDAGVRFGLAIGIAEVIGNLAEDGIDGGKALSPLMARIVEAVPGARCASLVTRANRQKPPTTYSVTGRLAIDLDQLQIRACHGPCLDALSAAELIQVDDLATDQRWPALGRPDRPMPIRSVLSVPVRAGDGCGQSLNLYAEAPYAFDANHHPVANLSAAALGLALTAIREHERAEHLRVALGTNRQIGAAMGILMARHGCSAEEAFTALRVTSQHLHRKLRDIADEVVFTGTLPGRHDRRTSA